MSLHSTVRPFNGNQLTKLKASAIGELVAICDSPSIHKARFLSSVKAGGGAFGSNPTQVRVRNRSVNAGMNYAIFVFGTPGFPGGIKVAQVPALAAGDELEHFLGIALVPGETLAILVDGSNTDFTDADVVVSYGDFPLEIIRVKRTLFDGPALVDFTEIVPVPPAGSNNIPVIPGAGEGPGIYCVFANQEAVAGEPSVMTLRLDDNGIFYDSHFQGVSPVDGGPDAILRSNVALKSGQRLLASLAAAGDEGGGDCVALTTWLEISEPSF